MIVLNGINKFKLLAHSLGALVVYTFVFSSLQSKNIENYTAVNPFSEKKHHSHSVNFSTKHATSSEFFFIETEEREETESNNHSQNNPFLINYTTKTNIPFLKLKKSVLAVFQYTSYERLLLYDLYCRWKTPSFYILLA